LGFSSGLRYHVDDDRNPHGGAQKEEEYVQQIRRNAQAVSARAQGRHLHGDAADRQAGRASQGNRRHSTGDVRSAGRADEGR